MPRILSALKKAGKKTVRTIRYPFLGKKRQAIRNQIEQLDSEILHLEFLQRVATRETREVKINGVNSPRLDSGGVERNILSSQIILREKRIQNLKKRLTEL